MHSAPRQRLFSLRIDQSRQRGPDDFGMLSAGWICSSGKLEEGLVQKGKSARSGGSERYFLRALTGPALVGTDPR